MAEESQPKTEARCSAPTCTSKPEYEVIAHSAGENTGKRFYTCERHSSERDFRRPIEYANLENRKL